jgi:acetylornithine/succinyldiaminopimelate/putrescine aminotransferase
MCLAKALAGGLPMGACLATPPVAATLEAGDHASTFGGGPVQSAAALATLSVIEDEGLIERATVAGATLTAGLGKIFGTTSEVRGRGLLIGVELATPQAHAVAETALSKGLLLNNATDTVVRIAPPLVITDAEIDRALDVLEEVWDEVSAS